MKMKAVTELTGLTDRAVRLYIDNGLIKPDISENYAGRKNIEFSDNDVDRLKNIAVLRKAGFPISDIGLLISDSSQTRRIIDSFIECNEKEIENKREIISRLRSIGSEQDISVETVCQALRHRSARKRFPMRT